MKALVYAAPERVELRELPRPEPGPGEALLRVSLCGVCGSDLHGFLGHNDRRRPGLVFGHEAVGRIEEAHPSVRDWPPGRRAVFNPLITCGSCPRCRGGKPNLCPSWQVVGMDRRQGALAEYVAVPAFQLHPVEEDLDDRMAIFSEPLANVVHFFRISLAEPPETVAVFGAGTIGSLAILLARARGVPRAGAVDRSAARLETARALGADLAVHGEEQDPVEAVRRWTGGAGADYVVETAGLGATRRAAVAACRPGGRVLFIGMGENESPLPWIDMMRQEKAVFTTFTYTPEDFLESVRLVGSRRFDLAPWTEVRPLEEGQEGFVKMTRDPGSTLKLAFRT